MGRGGGNYVSVTGGQGSQRMSERQTRNFTIGSERESRDVLLQRQQRQQQMRERVNDALNRSASTAADRRARQNAINQLSREQIESVAGRLNANQFTLLNRQQQKWYTDATQSSTGGSRSSGNPIQQKLQQGKSVTVRPGDDLSFLPKRLRDGIEWSFSRGEKEVILNP